MANRNSIRQRRIRKLDKAQRRKLKFYGVSRQYWITIQEADARKGYNNDNR